MKIGMFRHFIMIGLSSLQRNSLILILSLMADLKLLMMLIYFSQLILI